MPLPRPTVRTDLHEGQGERKDGDGGTHLITSASGNKHHPVSQTQARPPLPPTVVLWSQKCNHKLLLDLHSQSTRTVHIQCHQLWANHLVHCRRRQG